MRKRGLIDFLLPASVVVVLVFFYIPIATLVLFSFTSSRFLSWPIPGFSLRWYGELLADRNFWAALTNSAVLAAVATVLATTLGILGAFAWMRWRFRCQRAFQVLTFAPLLFPQLLLGVVMLLWFSVLAGWLNTSPGLWSAVIGHVVYITPFAIVIVSVQMYGFDTSLEQAAEDAGASRWQVLSQVTLPLLWPGIFSALIFAFLLSWGNFYITYSLSGSARTLPTYVFSGIAVGSSPIYPALATLTFAPALVLIVIVDVMRRRAARRRAGA
ncbi:ABC transporter permease [Pseudogemmobacter humi]|uniref:Inner membrane ABC transporter permease protein YdcV n=1 Tax=Pseudogemmobacter humi TaxID=2483812 RepID=A0A3P5XFG7_9RHOB|nr:ABC transporter permease [Pseudogemmobacter humi]VDC33482.1 Inner membrane ABC transporter permease protein YdcV [Pseudogemmobacter humi]